MSKQQTKAERDTAERQDPKAERDTAGDESKRRDAENESPKGGAPAGEDGGVRSGPGTGVEAPPEDGPAYPTRQLVHDPDGTPIEAPDAEKQVMPEFGYADSSTDDVYAAAGGRTIAGEDHIRIENEDGGEVDADSLFDDDDGDAMHLTVKDTVFEVFTYANAPDIESKRLLLIKGQQIPRQQAAKMKAAPARKQEAAFAQDAHGEIR